MLSFRILAGLFLLPSFLVAQAPPGRAAEMAPSEGRREVLPDGGR